MAATVRASTAPAGTLNPLSPASTVIGDLVIVITATVNNANGIPVHTLQSGFTQIISHSHDDGTTDGRVSIAWKVATVAGAANYQAYTSSGGTSDHSCIVVITKDTFDATIANIISASVTGTTNAAPDPPQIITTRPQALVLLVGFWHYGATATATTVTQPANYAAVTEYAASATCELAVSQRTLATATTENPAIYVDNTTPNGTVAITFAIYPRALSLVCDRGAFTLTGNAAGLTAQRKITAATGSFVLTGNSAGLAHGYKMVAAGGTFTLTGNAAVLRAARKIVAAAGSFALIGQNAGLAAQRKLVCAAGGFNVAGNAAILTTQRKIAASSGTFAFSGVAAGLIATRRLVAGAGAFAVAGQAAGLTAQRKLVADPGVFVVVGNDANFPRGYRLEAERGQFTLTGNAATLSHGGGGGGGGASSFHWATGLRRMRRKLRLRMR